MITVLRAPPFATVQDLGRRNHLGAAVPPAGALDRLALAAGNLLVGNSRKAAGLELGIGAGAIRFERPVTLALTGARATTTLGSRRVEMVRAVPAAAGDTLEIERVDAGAWLYLAVSGGIDVPPVLGSRSTYLPARFGGLEGRLLRSGDQLPLGSEPERVRPVTAAAELLPEPSGEPVRILPGPDRGLLSPETWNRLVECELRVSRAVSRMGYRLEGFGSEVSVAGDRPSVPACVGALQLPAGGEPIVLLCDGPTVGGYAQIAVVVTADLGRLAQRRPGEVVRFRPVDLAEARQAFQKQEALLDRLERGA